MSDIGTALDDAGGAVGDFFGMLGSETAGKSYTTAAQIAQNNEQLTMRSGEIQQQQENQSIIQSIGDENASVSGAGFAQSGSATDLLRMSTQKGALDKQLLANQTEITAQGFQQQANAYEGQATAAKEQATGQGVGGILKTVGTIASIASVVGWVICTELVRQHRMPRRFWMPGAAIFAQYPDFVREGYFVWAVPSVRHLRAHPNSIYSRCLEKVFNWRAENIAAHAGVKRARKLWRGAAVTAVLWPICYGIGAVRYLLNKSTDWKGLYRAEH
jgi:hypothetical protein